ncbi:MAG TPA: histidinol-phosphate transaminase [Sphingomicrobium sp.]|nr:histidinol-phosphate transaminase [Sphingomicrobium sp.]
MTSLAARLARPEVLELAPLDLAASDSGYGPATIKLDANESPYPPLVGVGFADTVNRYPEPQPKQLKAAMAALYGVSPDNLVITRGADDAIDILIRAFCRPGVDAISILQPTFSAYAHFARLQGARVVEAKLDENFDFSLERFLDDLKDEQTLKLAFVCSPNNPTGNPVPPEDVLKLADTLPETIIVLDEAYIEFSDLESLSAEAAIRDNLVVLRTLSKAYGLAGARVGALIACPELAQIAAKALPPYPLPSLSIEAACQALLPSRRPIHWQRIEEIREERARMAVELKSSPIVRSVREGGGNFLFLEVEDPGEQALKLQSLGIKVRFRPNAAPGGLRLTIGTREENDAALQAFGISKPISTARRATIKRDTKETSIVVAVDLDRAEPRQIDTGIGFFDHMLDQVAAHGGFSLSVACNGDLHIDGHHSIEDVALGVGQAISQALGERRGIGRFGFSLPMDEAEAQVLLDLSGRPFCRFEGAFSSSQIGAFPTQMTAHVFRSLSDSLGAAIHVRVSGTNDHHKTESCFKAFGRALRQAIASDMDQQSVPSTKGSL